MSEEEWAELRRDLDAFWLKYGWGDATGPPPRHLHVVEEDS